MTYPEFEIKTVEVNIQLAGFEEGGRKGYVMSGYTPTIKLNDFVGYGRLNFKNNARLNPGESKVVSVTFTGSHDFIKQVDTGARLELLEGSKQVGIGRISPRPQSLKKMGM